MDKDEQRFSWYQIWIAIGTLVATPIFSALAVSWQTRGSQEAWVEQQRFNRREKIADTQVQLMEEINTMILDLEISAKRIKQEKAGIAFLYVKSGISKEMRDQFDGKEKLSEIVEMSIEYHRDLMDLTSKAQMMVLYFGPRVHERLRELTKQLEANFKGPESFEKLEEILLNPTDALLIAAAEEIKGNSIDTIPELEDARLKLLEAMVADIGKSMAVYLEE
jgi:hypothetical protein